MTDIVRATAPLVATLEALGVPYYIGGSVASSAHGLARTTLDVDIAAALTPQHVSALANRLEPHYVLDAALLREAVDGLSSFNLIHTETFIKLDVFVQPPDAFGRAALERSRGVAFSPPSGDVMRVASPEDIVLHKLRWYRLGDEVSERQWLDVLGVLKVQAEVDLAYLQRWADELHVADLLERALREAGLGDKDE